MKNTFFKEEIFDKNKINMIFLDYLTNWDDHKTYNYLLWAFNRNEYIGSYQLEVNDEIVKIQSIYVSENYRGKKFSHKLIEHSIEKSLTYDKDIFLLVRADNFIIKTYIRYGFKKYSKKTIKDIKYIWMKLEKK